jgi:5'-nucleotidase/UDP-sugar diphosphatase
MKNFATAVLSMLFLCCVTTLVCAEPVSIRILHVNDFHGFAEPDTPYGFTCPMGGVAWLAGRADHLRKEKPTLYLAAGDMIQGNNWANLSRGKSVIELMNLMGFDAMAVGNHEFDFGPDVLRQRVSEARFPVLAANVEGLDFLRPYVIEELNGVRVAVIGIVTEDTPVATHPRNVAGLAFRSPFATLARYIPELRKNADVVIVLSHVGYGTDRLLAEQVPGIDLIVGGHSHTRLEKPTRVGHTVIVQAWEHARALGVVDVSVDNGRVVSISSRLEDIRPDLCKPDPDVQRLVEKYRRQVDAVLDGMAGEALVPLDGENVRKRETNLGNLVADIMRSVSGADATIINGGGIRASIPAGPIRVRDVFTALPFDNYIVAVRLNGTRIRQALEHGVAQLESGSGAFPQVSGISFSYDPSAPAGSRVREVLLGGEPLDPMREYTVATNDFLAAGGDGYAAFGEAVRSSQDFEIIGGTLRGEKLVYNDSGRWLRDVVVGWLKEKQTTAPVVENRICEVQR